MRERSSSLSLRPWVWDLPKHLDEAIGRIERLFSLQCESGAATTAVRKVDESAVACGQFLDGERTQRGLYGIAAALQVLGRANADPKLLQGLIRYLTKRVEIEGKTTTVDPATVAEKDKLDRRHVIKSAETVLGLSCVSARAASVHSPMDAHSTRLLQGRKNKESWAFFLNDSDSPASLVPTAFAVHALASAGYSADIKEAEDFLVRQLESDVVSGSDANLPAPALAEKALILYVLAYNAPLNERLPDLKRKLNSHLRRVWRLAEPLMEGRLEQNSEFWLGNKHFYVRIPWQLYLIGAAAKLSPNRVFGSRSCLDHLWRVVDQESGLIYPYSGTVPSTRTNAILHEVLLNVRRELTRTHRFLLGAYWFDVFRNCLSHVWVSRAAMAFAFVFICYVVFDWWSSQAGWGDVAPDFIAPAVLIAFSLKKGRR